MLFLSQLSITLEFLLLLEVMEACVRCYLLHYAFSFVFVEHDFLLRLCRNRFALWWGPQGLLWLFSLLRFPLIVFLEELCLDGWVFGFIAVEGLDLVLKADAIFLGLEKLPPLCVGGDAGRLGLRARRATAEAPSKRLHGLANREFLCLQAQKVLVLRCLVLLRS